VIVTVRETPKEMADCMKKAVVVRGRSGVLMRSIFCRAPARRLNTGAHFLVS
jgi:hypothetical protein